MVEQRPDVFKDGDWRVRLPSGKLAFNEQAEAILPRQFLEDAAQYFSVEERADLGAAKSKSMLEDANRGQVFLTPDNQLVVPVAWKLTDETPVPLDFPKPRAATIVDYREFPDLFKGAEWLISDDSGSAVTDSDGTAVTAARYMANPKEFRSPWGYYNEEGRHVPIEELLGDDKWRDRTLLVGTIRGERDMDIRAMPPNDDGTPVKPYQLKQAPQELLIRQGNQGAQMYGGNAYFRWVRTKIDDPEKMKRNNLDSYNDVVLARISLPAAVTIERLEKGVLAGYVTKVTIKDEVLADIERDGLEKTWEVFKREQDRMREEYLARYDIEKNQIGGVNFELKDREDALKRIRYENRDSRKVYTALDELNKAHDVWQAGEPEVNPDSNEEAYSVLLDAWLLELKPLLDAWMDAWMDESRKLNDVEKQALERARMLEEQRAELRAKEYGVLNFRMKSMRHEEQYSTYTFSTSDGRQETLLLAEVVRAFQPNEKSGPGKIGVYADRVWEFLSDDPRESNTEGGIWPVILGTLIMTLLMCVAVVPFGVIAALYLREYAKQGPIVSAVRIAVNNLAGVPSIVFGIFGLGFFCVMMGGTIDDLFFPELKPAPVFGGGGIMWASLTLALLTVPVVIVSTEEALSAVPSSQREASLACGASKFQTVWKVILPQALPGVLTGTILAMARGAGEVAPLMLVGAVKYAPYPAADSIAPFVHLERKFMHLGFHIYDVGFQSPNVDNTKPLVFATALVLIGLVAVLNVFAIALRNRLRKKFATSAV